MNLCKTLITIATLTGLLTTGRASAHPDAYLDAQAAPHGGQLRMAGAYHFELVVTKDAGQARNNPVVVYVTDHAGAPASTAGAQGTITLLAGKVKTVITLTPDGSNALKGIGNYAATPDMKAVVLVTLAGKAAEQARFTPLAPPETAKPGEHAGH